MKLGLIGAGRWGKRYIETISRIPGIELGCLASRNPESISLVPSSCKIVTDWRELLDDSNLNGVIIASPPDSHFEITMEAIRVGVPVLIEKPMTTSLHDAQNILKKSNECKVLAMVGHTHLFSAAFRELQKKGKLIGKIKNIGSAGGNWGPFRPDTPPLWDWAPHDLAMIIELLSDYPSDIKIKRDKLLPQPQGTGEAFSITLGFSSGICADIKISNICQQKQRIFEARYDAGTLTYNDLAQDKLIFLSSSKSKPEPVLISKTFPLTNLIIDFCRAIEDGHHSHPSLQLGVQVIQILTECQKSLTAANKNK